MSVDNANGRIDAASLKAIVGYDSLVEDGDSSRGVGERAGLDPDDIVNIQFTSGTTR